ncbi:MAG: YihY family inner membrane protein [Sedimentisphaerales bacterium]|nr:YihY family inner membrane protein [Sedimentisphaerales bacterium]
MLTLEKLLTTPTTQLGKAGRFVVFQIKLWSHCARLLKLNRSGQQAAALSYHTIFGIVPLAIVTLMIFQLFPSYSYIGERVKNFIYNQANFTAFKSPDPLNENSEETIALTEHLDAIVARFFDETNRGQIGFFSILIVIWAALALLATIEKSFNNIWHVATGRNFLHRIISYWTFLTLGPLILGTGIYLVTQYSKIANIQETVLSHIAPAILSYFVATAAFFLLYFVMPNTKVNFKAAVWGATVAALVWMAARSIFGYCITELGLYRTVYGVMALIPMTVVWIYITWLTVLFGLQLTYTTQHLKSLDAAEIAAAKKTEEHFIANDLTVINIVRVIAEAFQDNHAPVPPEDICGKLDIPAEFGQKILDHLVNSRLIARTSEPEEGFLPARDPANIKLSDIAEAAAATGFAQPGTNQPDSLQQIAQSQQNILSRHTLKEILNPEQETIDSGKKE